MGRPCYVRVVSKGAENAVAGVAETGNDVGVVVEGWVAFGGIDLHVWVFGGKTGDAGFTGDQTNLKRVTPWAFSVAMASQALPPVASMGSTTMTVAFSTSGGIL